MPSLLTTNSKLAKSRDHGHLSAGLEFLPGNKSGAEMCPHRGACFATCIDGAGFGNIPRTKQARLRRASHYIEDPTDFLAILSAEITIHAATAQHLALIPTVRLNVFSDLPWEEIAPNLFPRFPAVQFLDYTKSPDRARAALRPGWPPNYHLLYSWNEKATNQFGTAHLRAGGNIAAVTREHGADLPTWMQKAPQVDGDAHDLIHLHAPGSILQLTPKANLKHNRTQFA